MKLNELDVDGVDAELVDEFARLHEEFTALKVQLNDAKKKFEESEKKIQKMLDAISESEDRVLRTKKYVVWISKKGYISKSVAYKDAFELSLTKVNSAIRAILEEARDVSTKPRKYSPELSVSKVTENKRSLTENVLSILNKLASPFIAMYDRILKGTRELDSALDNLESVVKKIARKQ